jgi:hypothetical protein
MLFLLKMNSMSSLAKEIKNMTTPQKAELYHLLGQDAALNNYIFSNKKLFEELEERDNAVANGSMELISRQELSLLLNKNRHGL